MGKPGRLIYRRSTSLWILLLVPVAPIAALGAAVDDRNVSAGIVPAVISAILIVLILWIAIGWAGRTRLAEIWLDGDTLVARRGHLFNRGGILRIPFSQTRNWKAALEKYGHQRVEAAEFDYQGVTYILQIEGSQYADVETLNAWIDVWNPAGEKA